MRLKFGKTLVNNDTSKTSQTNSIGNSPNDVTKGFNDREPREMGSRGA